jgi:eukaryotic-like serine/threonine-protein kinase
MSVLTPTDPEQSAPFLQQRVAAFGLISAGLGGVFWLFRAVLALVTSGGPDPAPNDYQDLDSPSFAFHGLGIVFALVLWALCRNQRRSRRFIERAELVCLLASVVCYELMGATIRLEAHPELIMLLALTLLMLARAVYIPSTAQRSLLLGVITGVPLVASVGIAYALRSTLAEAFTFAAVTATWWSMTVLLTTATSRVIYGLRREASRAAELGQYTIEEKIGEGGMGIVYRAKHAMLRRPTAIKLLRPERAADAQLARFEREVQLSARLTHPNTITIFDYGRTPDGILYYAMELLDGATLEEVVQYDGPQPAERVAHVLEQITGALTEAHGIGLIHRDIKPANIILCEQGGAPDVAKIVDFGLVKQLGNGAEGPDATTRTGDHAIAGTPQYLSPEAILKPESADGRSDLYSLGAVAYYLLTGEPVFPGTSVVEVLGQHLHAAPVPPAERLGAPVPEPLSELVLRCLSKDPGARPASATALLDELRALGLANAWDPRRAELWWKTSGRAVRERRERPAASTSARTIAVDLAGRFDRLDAYLARHAE